MMKEKHKEPKLQGIEQGMSSKCVFADKLRHVSSCRLQLLPHKCKAVLVPLQLPLQF
jgi:hypothetical protein